MMDVVPADVGVVIGKPYRAAKAGLRRGAARPIQPGALIAAKGPQASAFGNREMLGRVLVARKHDALQFNALPARDRDRSADIGCKLLRGLAFLEAIEVRESMRADLLAGTRLDQLQQPEAEIVGVVGIAAS